MTLLNQFVCYHSCNSTTKIRTCAKYVRETYIWFVISVAILRACMEYPLCCLAKCFRDVRLSNFALIIIVITLI